MNSSVVILAEFVNDQENPENNDANADGSWKCLWTDVLLTGKHLEGIRDMIEHAGYCDQQACEDDIQMFQFHRRFLPF